MARNKQRIARSPISLGNAGAVMSIINQALNVPVVQIALGSYIEGRGLPGNWKLDIQSARLVPMDIPAPSGDSA